MCTPIIPEVTQCTDSADECCSTADCSTGRCVHWPDPSYCGGMQPMAQNRCIADDCQSDADCESIWPFWGVCVEAGVFGHAVRTCVNMACRVDADCNAKPGGRCMPVVEPCCSQPRGLFCNYPGEGCRDESDCPDGYCGINEGSKHSECVAGDYACPA
jgi:hypothetical protein